MLNDSLSEWPGWLVSIHTRDGGACLSGDICLSGMGNGRRLAMACLKETRVRATAIDVHTDRQTQTQIQREGGREGGLHREESPTERKAKP